MTFGKKEEQIFLGRDFTQTKDYSEKTAVEIDNEVRLIITAAYDRAKELLQANLDVLHKMAAELLEKGVLDGAEIDEIVRTMRPHAGTASEPQPAA
jgi:cell division protease FtsH